MPPNWAPSDRVCCGCLSVVQGVQACSIFFMLKGLTAIFSVLVLADAPVSLSAVSSGASHNPASASSSSAASSATSQSSNSTDSGPNSGTIAPHPVDGTDAAKSGEFHPTTITLLLYNIQLGLYICHFYFGWRGFTGVALRSKYHIHQLFTFILLNMVFLIVQLTTRTFVICEEIKDQPIDCDTAKSLLFGVMATQFLFYSYCGWMSYSLLKKMDNDFRLNANVLQDYDQDDGAFLAGANSLEEGDSHTRGTGLHAPRP